MEKEYIYTVKFAWLPKISFEGSSFWFTHYIEVTMINGIVLIDKYERLGAEIQANWMVEHFNSKCDEMGDSELKQSNQYKKD